MSDYIIEYYFFTEADMKEKILIIEDDPLIRNELKTLLQSNGYEAAAPEDFSDVIDRIKAEQPHLILLVLWHIGR